MNDLDGISPLHNENEDPMTMLFCIDVLKEFYGDDGAGKIIGLFNEIMLMRESMSFMDRKEATKFANIPNFISCDDGLSITQIIGNIQEGKYAGVCDIFINMIYKTSNLPECIQLVHTTCPDVALTSDASIAQILTMLKTAGVSLSTPCISLNLIQSKTAVSDETHCDNVMKASDFNPLPSPLQIFSSRGGLSLLAHYLPTVYPDQPKTAQKLSEKDKNLQGEWVKGEWIKIEPNEEIYEDVDDSILETSSKIPVISSVPQHSLAAFGLFLKLPAYSEVLLRDKVRAQCLLRLILGVTGDGEGSEYTFFLI